MGPRNYKSEILTSPLAYKILRQFVLLDSKDSYPSQVAEELDKSYTSVNNYMKGFREWGLLEPTEQKGKKKLYSINEDILVTLFAKLWTERADESTFQEAEKLIISREEEIEKKAPHLIKSYSINYLEEYPEGRIKQMLTEDFFLSLPKDLDWVWKLKQFLKIYWGSELQGDVPMRSAMIEVEERPENGEKSFIDAFKNRKMR